jgi:ElaB/YqjD/DUF883 family membrane-anchored ribosome-binding protein
MKARKPRPLSYSHGSRHVHAEELRAHKALTGALKTDLYETGQRLLIALAERDEAKSRTAATERCPISTREALRTELLCQQQNAIADLERRLDEIVGRDDALRDRADTSERQFAEARARVKTLLEALRRAMSALDFGRGYVVGESVWNAYAILQAANATEEPTE